MKNLYKNSSFVRKCNPSYVTKVTESLYNILTKVVLSFRVTKNYFCYLPDYTKPHKTVDISISNYIIFSNLQKERKTISSFRDQITHVIQKNLKINYWISCWCEKIVYGNFIMIYSHYSNKTCLRVQATYLIVSGILSLSW